MKAIKALVIALLTSARAFSHAQSAAQIAGFPALTGQLGGTLAKQLLSFQGGQDQDAPCEAFSLHGFNGQEADVLPQTVAWIAQPR